jgi:hypothetical protein
MCKLQIAGVKKYAGLKIKSFKKVLTSDLISSIYKADRKHWRFNHRDEALFYSKTSGFWSVKSQKNISLAIKKSVAINKQALWCHKNKI